MIFEPPPRSRAESVPAEVHDYLVTFDRELGVNSEGWSIYRRNHGNLRKFQTEYWSGGTTLAEAVLAAVGRDLRTTYAGDRNYVKLKSLRAALEKHVVAHGGKPLGEQMDAMIAERMKDVEETEREMEKWANRRRGGRRLGSKNRPKVVTGT